MLTKEEAVRFMVDKLVECPLSDDELAAAVAWGIDLLMHGDRSCGPLMLRMCAQIAMLIDTKTATDAELDRLRRNVAKLEQELQDERASVAECNVIIEQLRQIAEEKG